MRKQEFINKINAVLPRGLKVNRIVKYDICFDIYFTSKKPVDFCDEYKCVIEKDHAKRFKMYTVTLFSAKNCTEAICHINYCIDLVRQKCAISHTAAQKELRAYKAHLNTKKGAQERAQTLVANIISDHEKYKKSFFWSPAGSASQRRSNEWSRNVSFTAQGAVYTVSQDYSESCRNCYYNCSIVVNGVKKDIRALKNLVEVL